MLRRSRGFWVSGSFEEEHVTRAKTGAQGSAISFEIQQLRGRSRKRAGRAIPGMPCRDLSLWGPSRLVPSCLWLPDGSTKAQNQREACLSLRPSKGANPGQGAPSLPRSREGWWAPMRAGVHQEALAQATGSFKWSWKDQGI